jgi:hypothetical protein
MTSPMPQLFLGPFLAIHVFASLVVARMDPNELNQEDIGKQ